MDTVDLKASQQKEPKELEPSPETTGRTIFGVNPMKVLFAMEYVLQGLANPFQGITYQPFFKHFRFDYGLTEAQTQNLFSQSYLAWSFKPILGFFMDAFGKTKVVLTVLLSLAVLFYFFTPLFDTSHKIFFWMMFVLATVLAATDVAVDRATVIEGDEAARSSGRSKSSTVGLNQAICWAAIYGTSIIAAVSGGYIADHIEINYLMYLLALVPAGVLIVVFMLPKDTTPLVPLKQSVVHFWEGLNTGPILWIILFYFLFHFQPAMGALWTNYLIQDLHFSQTEIGIADGATYIGLFLGVIIFAYAAVKWQEKLGLKRIFKIFILLSIAINLTQYLLIDPWFTTITKRLHALVPFVDYHSFRLAYLCVYNFSLAIFQGIVRMSTFSLVGAVIPVNAAGSLFAGFMSVSNLAYAFSYSSGAWLYEHGMQFPLIRVVQRNLFGMITTPSGKMSIAMLILIGSLAYLLSFAAAHMLPDRRQTQATGDDQSYMAGPERYRQLGPRTLRLTNISAMLLFTILFITLFGVLRLDIISATISCFFTVTFIRKVLLDFLYHRQAR